MNARTLVFLSGLAVLPACTTSSSTGAASPTATPSPSPTPNRSRPIKSALNDRLESADKVFHVGCKDPEKSSCKDPSRVCGAGVEGEMKAAVKKKEIAVEWEAPRETWEKNEGVLDHYWFVKPDGSGTYYYLLPSPDDVQTDCGNGEYCGWHQQDFPAGALFAAGKFHFTPKGPKGGDAGKEIADLQFCPPPPPQ